MAQNLYFIKFKNKTLWNQCRFNPEYSLQPVLWIRNDFFGYESYFSVGFGSYMNFSNILTDILPYYSRIVSALGCMLLRETFL
jgi:hypothetical protein